MGPLDLALHALNFAIPALAVAVGVSVAARLVLPSRPKTLGWWAPVAINSIVGLVVLAAGLWYFGVDGKVATYTALVAAISTSEWLLGRGWAR